MKKIIITLSVLLFVTGCSQTAEYSRNLEVSSVDSTLVVNQPLQKAYIYINKSLMGNQSFKSSTRLGEDNLNIDLGQYTAEGTNRFFRNYLKDVQITHDSAVLATSDLIIMPEIGHFSYGFYSADGFDVDAKPYVSYSLNLAIYKNGREIYKQNISTAPRHFGELTFFGTGISSYIQIGPILQRAIATDYSENAREILQAINSI
ncbi:MAG: hypothetical protein GXZ15_03035 [Campylobacter sp.]|nr:hypothetical protein [Campylobacter sp.]